METGFTSYNSRSTQASDAQAQLSLFGGRENGTGGGSENSVQQLKAEIAAAYNEHLSHCNTPEFGRSHMILMDKLRQLSAI
jgi:hypothetical protein